MSSPPRSSHNRNLSLSEAVLGPQAIVQDAPPILNGDAAPPVLTDEVSVDLAEHHEALMGAEFRNPNNINKQPTLATLGDTPFHDDGEDIEHHRVVATEIVKDPLQFGEPEPILQNVLVLLDP